MDAALQLSHHRAAVVGGMGIVYADAQNSMVEDGQTFVCVHHSTINLGAGHSLDPLHRIPEPACKVLKSSIDCNDFMMGQVLQQSCFCREVANHRVFL